MSSCNQEVVISQLKSNIQLKFRTFDSLIQNIMGSNEFAKSEVFSFSNSVEYADGSIVSKTVLKKQTGNISLFSFDKGEALSEHTAPFDAMIQVVDGKGEIIIGGKSFFLKTGDSIIMPADIPHAVKAIEKFKMVLTMIKSS